MKSKRELKILLKNKGVNLDKTLIFSCGSGVTACVPLLACYELCAKKLNLYNGSWTEYGTILFKEQQDKQKNK